MAPFHIERTKMKPRPEEWTIVIAGRWNPQVFTPQWVSTNVFNAPKVTFDVSAETLTATIRYQTDSIVLIPSAEKLILGVANPKLSVFLEVETLAKKVLATLQHTPITGIGVNICFTSDAPDASILKSFEFSDSDQFNAIDSTLLRSELFRMSTLEDMQLNFKLYWVANPLLVGAHLNFHKALSSADEGKKYLEGRVERCFGHARNLLNAYKLEEASNALK